MTFKELKIISTPHFFCLSLDRYLPRRLRDILKKGAALLALASFVLSFDALPLYFGQADGFFFLFVFFYLSLSFLEFFYRSMSGEGLKSRVPESLIDPNLRLDYSLSEILFVTDEIDVTRSLYESRIGLEVFLRAGIAPESVKDFIYSERASIIASSLNLGNGYIDLPGYLGLIYDADETLQSFLSRHSINREEFVGTARWIRTAEEKRRRRQRFWSRENLSSMPSVGTSWSYGVAEDLGKFGIPFESTMDVFALNIENGYRAKETDLLEGILQSSAKANAIIIDDSEAVARDIVGRLVKRIKLGLVPPEVAHKNVIELDWGAITAAYKTKGELESELLKVLNQSSAAGNVIIYVRDLSGFAASVKALNINLPSLLFPYLSSRNLPVIASTTNADFHYFVETTPALLERFERVIPDKAEGEASVQALLEQVPELEQDYDVAFSYPSILAVAKSADRFVTEGEMPGKALDMLSSIAPWAEQRKIAILREEDVASFISEKTGIDVGEIKEKEAEKIQNLEKLLHQRVIGQDEAVEGIASAIRRARSGIGNPGRPMASFLFIGPTGVGKTEVSKALTESFFGRESQMLRFDMSEYSGPEALGQLIGDFAGGKSGLLASKIRDNPYGVLLLDEFEKASPDVLDLFLQILDEGIFTDALGKQVMCRNLIIIATSNAGSEMIWQTLKDKGNLYKSKDMIVDGIIKDKIFKPELLNRFDGVILFHPLQKQELQDIARLNLQKLARRLKDRDLDIDINDDVVDFLVEKGGDPQFGGRAINRAIQNEIEDLIARKIVSGEAKPGSKISIKKEELV